MNDQTTEPLDVFAEVTLSEDSGPVTDDELREIIDNHAGDLLERREVEALADELLYARARIARITALADQADKETPDDWGVHYVYVDRLRKVIEEDDNV